ncbi:MAG: hypothetical protein Q9218_000016 [Villophora microphyllina]
MGRELNVIGFISGGKDSSFSLLHCIANGHKIIALANLSPPSHAMGDVDLNSLMYQTVGHTLIDLYALVAPVPLYRQEINGTAINQAKDYHAPSRNQLPRADTTCNDETESMIALLDRIKTDHPEANAVCSGAILSTYQRTRIESVALRMQLTSLAYLWQYPVLPTPVPREEGLLEDMAAVGLDARIVKVASGGLDEDLLLENVCAEATRKRIAKAMKRFGGSVLGEGGEFETFVVDGPALFEKGALDIRKEDGKTVRGGGGEARMTFAGGVIKWKDQGQKEDEVWLKELRIPDLLDMTFKKILETLDNEARSQPVPRTSLPVTRPFPGHYERLDQSSMSTGKRTVRIVNVCAPFDGDFLETQMDTISQHVTYILEQALHLSFHDIVFATIILRSMDNFHTINQMYSNLFSAGPNPPARVTIACGDGLPDGANVMISFDISLGPRTNREHLHVQSISYWTPANIGPYSQAISVPLGVDHSPKVVYVAGQIPLVPATMNIASRAWPANDPKTTSEDGNFRLQTTLALQHLWRIGRVMSVGWWIGAIAFITGGQDDLKQKVYTTASAWKAAHTPGGSAECASVSNDADNPDFDVWEQQHNNNRELVTRNEEGILPDFSRISVVTAEVSGLGQSDSVVVPPFFAVEVAQLPRDSEIEWQGLGLSQSCVKIFDTVLADDILMTVCSIGSDDMMYAFIELRLTTTRKDLVAQIQLALAKLQERCKVPEGIEGHRRIYTSQKINASDMPTEATRPLLNAHHASESEHNLPLKSPHLSRLPQPYARHRPDASITTQRIVDGSSLISSYIGTSNDLPGPNGGAGSKAFSDTDNRKRRKNATPQSDSGTEADDESGPILKGLPAPPARLRKGLKDDSRLGISSPLLTPSYLDDIARKEALEAQFRRRGSSQSQASTDEERVQIRAKFVKRRRAELIRRTTETVLLFSVGYIACQQDLLLPIRQDVTIFASVVCGTYLLYPFRLFYHHQFLLAHATRTRPFMRVPAAFDPATLLYPVLLPWFVSTSLLLPHDSCVTLNLVLGIASMPRAIIPLQDSYSGHTSMQWLLSILPIGFLSSTGGDLENTNISEGINPENLALLYPLHQALLPTLGYLTTTSLLPAELQLFSVSLINLLLSSASPQSLILQALLWIGGFSLFVFCRKVLEWEVALARIPTWRLRRNEHDARSYPSFLDILNRLSNGQFSYAAILQSDDSGSDDPQKYIAKQIPKNSRASTVFGNGVAEKVTKSRTMTLTSNTQAFVQQWPMKFDGASSPNNNEAREHRSSTLPSSTGSLKSGPTPGKDESLDHTFLPRTMPKSFRSLTKPQASIVKWLYAIYTYNVVILIIAVPIRSFIGHGALAGKEPIGWALGYLLGDIVSFRCLVAKTRLEQWIRLPQYNSAEEGVHGWAEVVRWHHLGAANTRLLICLHCVATIGFGLGTVFRLKTFADVDTRRKVFHGMMVVMFLPTIFVDPSFVALALILVLAVFLLLDLFRASQLPPLSRPLTNFLAPYVDGRDHRGPVIVSHIFLLIGCSIPLWLSLASVDRSGKSPWEGWEIPTRDLSMVSGVVCVGMGDAAASLIGRRYGRRRWCWSGGKSLEGSAAFAVAVMLGLSAARLWLLYGGWLGASGESWPMFLCKVGLAASGASLTEAVLTGGNDNVIVPVILWLLVRGLEI